jgi:hypothetical protein
MSRSLKQGTETAIDASRAAKDFKNNKNSFRFRRICYVDGYVYFVRQHSSTEQTHLYFFKVPEAIRTGNEESKLAD